MVALNDITANACPFWTLATVLVLPSLTYFPGVWNQFPKEHEPLVQRPCAHGNVIGIPCPVDSQNAPLPHPCFPDFVSSM